MIQRIQTIFLILAAGSFGALFKIPFATSSVASAQFLSDQVYDVQDNAVLSGVTILAIVVSLVCIFLFRKRKVQRRIVYLIILLAVGLVITSYVLLKNDNHEALQSSAIHVQFGLFLPLVAIVFCILAEHFIGKDDKLVKSMDRLR